MENYSNKQAKQPGWPGQDGLMGHQGAHHTLTKTQEWLLKLVCSGASMFTVCRAAMASEGQFSGILWVVNTRSLRTRVTRVQLVEGTTDRRQTWCDGSQSCCWSSVVTSSRSCQSCTLLPQFGEKPVTFPIEGRPAVIGGFDLHAFSIMTWAAINDFLRFTNRLISKKEIYTSNCN